jgi:hypothetical protein
MQGIFMSGYNLTQGMLYEKRECLGNACTDLFLSGQCGLFFRTVNGTDLVIPEIEQMSVFSIHCIHRIKRHNRYLSIVGNHVLLIWPNDI